MRWQLFADNASAIEDVETIQVPIAISVSADVSTNTDAMEMYFNHMITSIPISTANKQQPIIANSSFIFYSFLGGRPWPWFVSLARLLLH
jgi:hypothetical protein